MEAEAARQWLLAQASISAAPARAGAVGRIDSEQEDVETLDELLAEWDHDESDAWLGL